MDLNKIETLTKAMREASEMKAALQSATALVIRSTDKGDRTLAEGQLLTTLKLCGANALDDMLTEFRDQLHNETAGIVIKGG